MMNYSKPYENMRNFFFLIITDSAQQRGAQTCNHRVKVK